MEYKLLEATYANLSNFEECNRSANSSILRSIKEKPLLRTISKVVSTESFGKEMSSFLNSLISVSSSSQTVAQYTLIVSFLTILFTAVVFYKRRLVKQPLPDHPGKLRISGHKSLWILFIVFLLSSFSAYVRVKDLRQHEGNRGNHTLEVPSTLPRHTLFNSSDQLIFSENYHSKIPHITQESYESLIYLHNEVCQYYLDRIHEVLHLANEMAGILSNQMTLRLERLIQNVIHTIDNPIMDAPITVFPGFQISTEIAASLGKHTTVTMRNVSKTNTPINFVEIKNQCEDITYENYCVPSNFVKLKEFALDVGSRLKSMVLKHLAVFEGSSKTNTPINFVEIKNQCEDITYENYFVPSNFVKLKEFALDVGSRLKTMVLKHLAVFKGSLRSNESFSSRDFERKSVEEAYPVTCSITPVNLLSIAFVISTFAAFINAFLLMKLLSGFIPTVPEGVQWERIIVFSSLANLFLLLLIWALSLFLFLVNSLGMCARMRGDSPSNETLDNEVCHEKPPWFSTEFNMTVNA